MSRRHRPNGTSAPLCRGKKACRTADASLGAERQTFAVATANRQPALDGDIQELTYRTILHA